MPHKVGKKKKLAKLLNYHSIMYTILVAVTNVSCMVNYDTEVLPIYEEWLCEILQTYKLNQRDCAQVSHICHYTVILGLKSCKS